MKRTHSGDLSLNSSPTSSNNGATNNRNQNQQQQADANRQRAPAMQAPAANDPPPANPLFGLDVDTPLPDWEEFAQMLPHTPPVENRRDASDDEALSASDDEGSAKEYVSEGSSSDDGDKSIGANSSIRAISVHYPDASELDEILASCQSNPQITELEVEDVREFGTELQQRLINFFGNYRTVQKFFIESPLDSEEEMNPALLTTLFQNSGLKEISIDGVELPPLSVEEQKLMTEICKNNTSLKILRLAYIKSSHAPAQLLGALTENSTLEKLDLRDLKLKDLAEPLAALLRSNCQLKTLKVSLSSPSDLQGLEDVIAALKDNDTLEYLYLAGDFGDSVVWDFESWKPLMSNRALKILKLPLMGDMTAAAVMNLTELLCAHPTLISVRLGCIPQNQKNRLALADGLKSSAKLEHLSANLLNFGHFDENENLKTYFAKLPNLFSEFLNVLGESKRLTSLTFGRVPDMDRLIKFLETHPRITSLELSAESIGSKSNLQKLLALVKNSSHITKIILDEQILKYAHYKQLRVEIQQALEINRQIQGAIHNVSEAMKSLLDKQFGSNEALSMLPLDVTDELTKAIARHVPPIKARAIFDELILHAPTARR